MKASANNYSASRMNQSDMYKKVRSSLTFIYEKQLYLI